jgi:hypothetical protein
MAADDTKARENPTRGCEAGEAGKRRVPGTRDSAYSRTRERGLISSLSLLQQKWKRAETPRRL